LGIQECKNIGAKRTREILAKLFSLPGGVRGPWRKWLSHSHAEIWIKWSIV